MSDSDGPADVLAGTTVKRTSDGKGYELQPTGSGQLQLHPSASDDDTPVHMRPGQFVLSIKGGTYYLPSKDTDGTNAVLKAVKEIRDSGPNTDDYE